MGPPAAEFLGARPLGAQFEYLDGKLIGFALVFDQGALQSLKSASTKAYGAPNGSGPQPVWLGKRNMITFDASQPGVCMLMVGQLEHTEEMNRRMNAGGVP